MIPNTLVIIFIFGILLLYPYNPISIFPKNADVSPIGSAVTDFGMTNYSNTNSIQDQNLNQSKELENINIIISHAYLGLIPKNYLEISLIVFVLLTLLFMFTMFHSPTRKFYLKYLMLVKRTSEEKKETLLSKSYVYKNIFDREKLIPIVTNISHNLLASITIYGIFLSFIIVNQLQTALTSSIFIIWLSLILSVIVRGAGLVFILSDIWTRSIPMRMIKERIVEANQFYKNSIYLLVPVFASSVSFVLIPDDLVNINDNQFPMLSLTSIVLGTISLTYLFYHILNELEGRFTGESNIIFILLILLNSILLVELSPIDNFDFNFFGFQIPVPIIWVFILSMANLAWIIHFYNGYLIPIIAILIARMRIRNPQ